MINNSTNITWLNTKNSDDQQFHQRHLIEHKKETTTYDVGNPGSSLGQAYTCDGVKPDNGMPPSTSW
jgi:hypothetical protein